VNPALIEQQSEHRPESYGGMVNRVLRPDYCIIVVVAHEVAVPPYLAVVDCHCAIISMPSLKTNRRSNSID
jgi:hypothetical protein